MSVSTSSKIHTRPASSSDLELIVSLQPRLEEFGPPFWRHTAIQVLPDALLYKSPQTAIFFAEDDQSVSLGFISSTNWK